MNKSRQCLSVMLAVSVSTLIGSGFAIAGDTEVSEPVSDTIENIVATGEAVRFVEKAITVSYADLDLNSEEGALVLYRRLQRASETVCDTQDARKTRCPTDLREARHCYHRSLDSAVESVDSQMLASIHQDTQSAGIFAARPK